AFQPGDYTQFFAQIQNVESGYLGVWKYQWVPNGKATQVTNWGDKGSVTMPIQATGDFAKNWFSGVVTDRQYLYNTICRRDDPMVFFYIVDFDGSLVKTIDMTEWWARDNELKAGGQLTGGPNDIRVRGKYVYLNSHTSCLKSMVNPSGAMEDQDNFWVWHNGNGDYVNDHNFESTAKMQWVCFDFNVAPYNYTISGDANLFSMTPAYDMGAVSFSLMAPDGTGLGYFAYASETAAIKRGNFIVDNGSSFDGIYTDNSSTGADADAQKGFSFVAQDSFKGKITNQVEVSETPSTFSVAQNTPNPFNPATTISFTLAKAGKTTVEVLNTAGQRVEILLNANLSSGSHSVTWNASKCSAGVYFFTVWNGGFTKTMKMTLLK
ncbi:MAG: T9SS type A sorting domain-containing protein, partial [Candidatus Latescibacterota bacterium]